MMHVSVREVRNRLAELISFAQSGQTIEVTRRGKTVARLVPPRPAKCRKLPDLSDFHKTLRMSGKPMSQEVIDQRRKARY